MLHLVLDIISETGEITCMKSIFILIQLLFMLMFISCGVSSSIYNINGGFEESSYNLTMPDGWISNKPNYGYGNTELKIDNTISHSGNNSIMIFIDGKHSNKKYLFKWIRRIDGLKENSIYQLEAWIKTKNVKITPYLEINCWSKNILVGNISSDAKFSFSGSINWRPLEIIFKIPAGTDKIILSASMISYKNGGAQAWFDDISIKEIKENPRY